MTWCRENPWMTFFILIGALQVVAHFAGVNLLAELKEALR